MIFPSAATLRPRTLKIFVILSLGWMGVAMFISGLLVFGNDVYTWLALRGRFDLSLTSVFQFLAPLVGSTLSPVEIVPGIVEFAKVAPLSLVLMAIGWTLYKVAEFKWDTAGVVEESTWRRSLSGSD